MAGFDDVFDVQKLQAEEAYARIDAMRRRYQSAIDLDNEKSNSDRSIREVAAIDRLTGRERNIIETLLSDKNNFISYSKVQQICSDYHHDISMENAKVIICNLSGRGDKDVTQAQHLLATRRIGVAA